LHFRHVSAQVISRRIEWQQIQLALWHNDQTRFWN
jgi:hypothetical protein